MIDKVGVRERIDEVAHDMVAADILRHTHIDSSVYSYAAGFIPGHVIANYRAMSDLVQLTSPGGKQ